MFEQTILVGYLGKAPVMRFTAKGDPVTYFSMATSRKYKDKEETKWWRVSVFGSQAEACNDYLSKGSMVLVTGRLRADENGNPRTYERKDGTTGASFEVTADNVRFLGGKSDSVEAPEQNTDEEIPF
jgi:single-strand DNA-binding protein